MKQKLIELKRKINKLTTLVGYYNIPVPVIDRSLVENQ